MSNFVLNFGLGPLAVTLLVSGIIFGLFSNLHFRDPRGDLYGAYNPADHYSTYIQSSTATAIFALIGFMCATAIGATSSLYTGKNFFGLLLVGATTLLTVGAIICEIEVYTACLNMNNPLQSQLLTNSSSIKKYITKSLEELYYEAMNRFQNNHAERSMEMLTFKEVINLMDTKLSNDSYPDFENGYLLEMRDLWQTGDVRANRNFTVFSMKNNEIKAYFNGEAPITVAVLNVQKASYFRKHHEVCWSLVNQIGYKCKSYRDINKTVSRYGPPQFDDKYHPLTVGAYFIYKKTSHNSSEDIYSLRNFPMGYVLTSQEEYDRHIDYPSFSRSYRKISASSILKLDERVEKYNEKHYHTIKFCREIPLHKEEIKFCDGDEIEKDELIGEVEGAAPFRNLEKYPYNLLTIERPLLSGYSRFNDTEFAQFAFAAFIIQGIALLIVIVGKVLELTDQDSGNDNTNTKSSEFQRWNDNQTQASLSQQSNA